MVRSDGISEAGSGSGSGRRGCVFKPGGCTRARSTGQMVGAGLVRYFRRRLSSE